MTYSGEPVSGIPFFRLLYADDDFCKELGRCALECSRLEVALMNILIKNDISPEKNASLGRLIHQVEKNGLLVSRMLAALKDVQEQRNHMIHRLYSLFAGLSEETRLPRSNLMDSDVWTYIDYAFQVRENLRGLGDVLTEQQRS